MTTALSKFKNAFARSERWVHMNNAGQSPVCRPAFDTLTLWSKKMFEEGAHGVVDLFQEVDVARASVAQFLGAQKKEIAFFPGAAAAISQVAFGLELKSGDEVIVWDQEYGSNFYPWATACERSGAKLIVAKSDAHFATSLETLEKYVTPRTRVIGVSWVQFRTGARMDLRALSAFAKPRGIFVSVDIIQGAGCLPFDFSGSGVDAACGGSHKWLASFHGAGFLLLREEWLERLRPTAVGAMTFLSGEAPPDLSFPMKPDSSRFEPGGKAFLEILALGAAAKFFSDTGIDVISSEAQRLTSKLARGLEDRGYRLIDANAGHEKTSEASHRGAILNFYPGADSPYLTVEQIMESLTQHGIGFVRREPGVRLSPHAHNQDSDIDRVLAAVTR